jgi:cell division protein FtsW
VRSPGRSLGPPDYLLLAVVVALLVVGLLSLYSASLAEAEREYGNPNYFIVRQAIFALVGLAAMLALMRWDYRRLRRASVLLMLVSIMGLVAVLLPGIGVVRNGAARWLDVGPVEVQPSELAKLALVLYMSAWLASRGEHVRDLSLGFLPFVVIVGLVAGLVLVEPDMGTAVVLVLVACTLFFLAGAPVSHLALFLVVGALVSYAVVLTHDYRLARVEAFLAPEADPYGKGFQLLQLKTALASGGLMGLGWGASRQKFGFVPGAHTDGVFAILGEELGFVGAVAVLALFALLVGRGIYTAVRVGDPFGRLVAAGVSAWLGYQTLINIGGISGLIPLTGIPLPFFSYGGSALIANLAAVGLLLSVSRQAWGGQEARGPSPQGWWPGGPGRRGI